MLAGNASAHVAAIRCRLQHQPLSDLQHLTDREAWRWLSCSDGCPSLLEDVAQALDERGGLWSVIFVREAERAPLAQLNGLVSRFWQQARCVHATARTRVAVDCRRVLFVLSTSWGGEQLAQPEARSRSRERLHSGALQAAAPMLSSGDVLQRVRQQLRSAVSVVLGEETTDFFSALMRRQDEERRARRAQPDSNRSDVLPALSVFDRVVGQEAVVRELRQRISGIASGADGGEDAHTFFFYGFPGTGKTYLAELLAQAQHGRSSPPYYQRFSMQNYKTDEDLWKLVSPPCGVKGEGAFAALFAEGGGCGGGGCGGRGPVVLFDEIEEARPDFMTSALVNAIDHRGFVEFYRKTADGACTSEQARTAGSFIVLTSNCFMDELAEVWASERRSGRSNAEVYEATRLEMDRRIFEDGLPCESDGRASPFAARKMRDRMRGNVYPFLPLSEAEAVRALELQLHERADAYERASGMSLYWTDHYVAVFARSSMKPFSSAASPEYRARPNSSFGTRVALPSLRKQIEQMMRLDERSVERLYAQGSEECTARGSVLRRLVLHVRGGEASGAPFCGDVDGGLPSPGITVAGDDSVARPHCGLDAGQPSSQVLLAEASDSALGLASYQATEPGDHPQGQLGPLNIAGASATGADIGLMEEAETWDDTCPEQTEPLSLSSDSPIERWLRQCDDRVESPHFSGYVVLAGNASAHVAAIRCRLQHQPLSDLQHLTDREAWRWLSCSDGCPSLLEDVAQALDERGGLWSVIFVREAERAPLAQLNGLVSRFWQQARCVHATARTRVAVDCRRVLFVLSTSWGGEQLAQPEARSRSRERLHSGALQAAAPMLSSGDVLQRVRQQLRSAVSVVLGEETTDFFSALMRRQDEERRARRAQPDSNRSDVLPALSVFDRVVGQEAVVRELRQRISGIASGADGGEDAHTFFFYGFPGTGKTYLAELLAQAQHGRSSPPYYQRFSMQNYKTDEDLWKLVSPPCGVKGEGAFAALFAEGGGCGGGGCGGRGPVVLFDEIEEARPDFMTSALVNAIDHRGFVEFYRKTADGACTSEQARTAGSFIVLTSNCFMDELAEVWASERRSGRSNAEVYEATRLEMDRRIFEDGLPCESDGRASPFAARKMRDRMRGNVYPFLPLSEAEAVRALELQLHERADAYERASGMSLYWTSEFSQLLIRGAASETRPELKALGLSDASSVWSISTSEGGPRVALPSLRKQIEQMMRLDERSVERLYAQGSEECTAKGSVLRRLVLHVRGGEASGAPFCGDADGGKPTLRQEAGSISPPASISLTSTGARIGASAVAPQPLQAQVRMHSAVVDREVEAESLVSVQAELAKQAAAHAHELAQLTMREEFATRAAVRTAQVKHAVETDALVRRNAALEAEVGMLQEHLVELKTALWRWKLTALVLICVVAFLLVGAAYVAAAYAATLIKVALCVTVVAAVAGAMLVAACLNGKQTACHLQSLIVEALRWATWLATWAAWQLWEFTRALGGNAALILAVFSFLCTSVLWQRVKRRTRPSRSNLKDSTTEPAFAWEGLGDRVSPFPESLSPTATFLSELRRLSSGEGGG